MQPKLGSKLCPRLNIGEGITDSQRVLEIARRDANGGRQCAWVVCGTAYAGPPLSSWCGLLSVGPTVKARGT
jgi:hypothetical protein